jgi:hypothetical protein
MSWPVRCKECSYFVKNDGRKDGVCWHNPPTPFPIQQQGLGGMTMGTINVRPTIADPEKEFCAHGFSA